MVNVSIHTGSKVRAEANGTDATHWISFKTYDGSDVTIYGTAAQA